jgi:multiple sugar transport system substrate-binding protein
MAAGLTGAAALGILLSFATALSAEAQDKTEITFSYLWGGDEAKAIESIISDFNASQDKIVVKGVSSPDATKQLASMSSANGAFDISDNFGSNVGAWASKGVLAPLDDLGIDTKDFVPAAVAQVTYDGKLYSVPIAVHDYQLIYNKKLLADAGVQPPQTMDDLAAAIKATTKVDASGNITQLGLGSAYLPLTMEMFGTAFGGDWNGGGKPTPTDPNLLKGVNFYVDNVIKPYGSAAVSKYIAGYGPYMSPQDPFATGKMAMVIDGEWRSSSLGAVQGLDWGATAIPAASDALANSTIVEVSTMFIPTNSKHKAEAAEFLKYFISPPVMTKFTRALGNLPARTSLLGDPAYKELPNYDAWLNALKSPNAKSFSSAPYVSEYTADLATAFDAIAQGSQTPEEALKAVADRSPSYAQ